MAMAPSVPTSVVPIFLLRCDQFWIVSKDYKNFLAAVTVRRGKIVHENFFKNRDDIMCGKYVPMLNHLTRTNAN